MLQYLVGVEGFEPSQSKTRVLQTLTALQLCRTPKMGEQPPTRGHVTPQPEPVLGQASFRFVRLFAYWWTSGESNPEFLLAKQVCSR